MWDVEFDTTLVAINKNSDPNNFNTRFIEAFVQYQRKNTAISVDGGQRTLDKIHRKFDIWYFDTPTYYSCISVHESFDAIYAGNSDRMRSIPFSDTPTSRGTTFAVGTPAECMLNVSTVQRMHMQLLLQCILVRVQKYSRIRAGPAKVLPER